MLKGTCCPIDNEGVIQEGGARAHPHPTPAAAAPRQLRSVESSKKTQNQIRLHHPCHPARSLGHINDNPGGPMPSLYLYKDLGQLRRIANPQRRCEGPCLGGCLWWIAVPVQDSFLAKLGRPGSTSCLPTLWSQS